MVHKPCTILQAVILPFENDVKMYGTQALEKAVGRAYWFENDVKMYGTQADGSEAIAITMFENDVKMYGTQAIRRG